MAVACFYTLDPSKQTSTYLWMEPWYPFLDGSERAIGRQVNVLCLGIGKLNNLSVEMEGKEVRADSRKAVF